MKKAATIIFLFLSFSVNAQRLWLDSTLQAHYVAKYGFSENLICIPFYCDPQYADKYNSKDTSMCGKFVFVDKNFKVKIPPIFQLPCSFEPCFSEGICFVNKNNSIVAMDTNGKILFNTNLKACSPEKNKIFPYIKGRAKVMQGNPEVRFFYTIYYIDRKGKKLYNTFTVNYWKGNQAPPNITPPVLTQIEIPEISKPNYYPISNEEAQKILSKTPHANNRMLLFYQCGDYQNERMSQEDKKYCGKFVFTDTFFNVKIGSGFDIPCAFEPQFAEGLAAVGLDSNIVYIDTAGKVVINTGLHSCNKQNNKASTFRNGIATLYQGDLNTPGLYHTIAINTKGERVRLLEFDELELAEKVMHKFSNVNANEVADCFIGKGKSNGYWFLVEKSGKVKRKLILK